MTEARALLLALTLAACGPISSPDDDAPPSVGGDLGPDEPCAASADCASPLGCFWAADHVKRCALLASHSAPLDGGPR